MRLLPSSLQWLLLLLGLGLLAALALNASPARPDFAAPAVELQFSGQRYAIPAGHLPALAALTRRHFLSAEQSTLQAVTAHIEGELDALFTEAHARVPELADWYYSLAGEYTRLLLPLLERGGVLGGDHLADRTEQILFGDARLAGRLDSLRSEVQTAMISRAEAEQRAWQRAIADRLETATGAESTTGPEATTLDLDRFSVRLSGYSEPEFVSRMTQSSGAAVAAMAAPVTWQAATRRAAASGRAAAARGGARVVGRAGGAAASGALACAPAGPLALGCALMAGTATWLGMDWLLLRADEARNREALEASLHEALVAARTTLTGTMTAHYQRASANRRHLLSAEIEYTFIPARHGQIRTPGTDPS